MLPQEKIRFYPGVPYQYQVLAGCPENLRSYFESVKWCISSGDVLPRQTYDRFLERTGHPIRSLYGSTEAGSISMDTSAASEVQFGSLGLPLRNVSVEIRDAGQIWVKSPVLPPAGYDNRPDLNCSLFRDGYYNTGDLGRIDERGHLVMTGRKQTFFDVGGNKVDLGEVEEVLTGHPQILLSIRLFRSSSTSGIPSLHVPLPNASRAAFASLPPSHGSGSGWFAIPFLYDSFIHYFTPVLSRRYPGESACPASIVASHDESDYWQ